MTTELIEQRPSSPEFIGMVMSMPVEDQQRVLQEYKERRKHFREWLLSNMKEGVHYGYPPGCKPRLNENGDAIVEVWDNGQKKTTIVPKDQWQQKPSLYEAGADLLIDMLLYRCEFSAATDIAAALGDFVGRFVFRCKLYSRQSGELVGEGIGASQVGEKDSRMGQPLNQAIKIGKKRSKVDAVKNVLGISDLFTQDMEDDTGEVVPPAPAENPPKAQPRSQRVTQDEINQLAARWKSKNPQGSRSVDEWKAAWFEFVRKNGGPRSAGDVGEWNRENVRSIDNMLKTENV